LGDLVNLETSHPEATLRFRDGAAWQTTGGYSRAVRRGNFIAVSGTTSSEPDGEVRFPGDTESQTTEAITRCLEAVVALGGSIGDVVRTRVYLAPEADWLAAASAHQQAFGDVAPANTMLHVAFLVGEGLLVEVELEALLLDEDA